ncbi:hypothetical protein KR222_004208, partial [Zaprionus bogoriensis]
MCRRCVVCGKEATGKAHHYPRNKNEALIWQRSMGAFDTSVETIQAYCCVCIKHIPKFVELVKQQAAEKAARDKLSRPSLNVLVLPGATLPPYCGNPKEIETKTNQDENLDADIIVRESNIKDSGASFPDIDEAELTVLHTPLTTADEDAPKSDKEETEQCGDGGNQGTCTEVLLLGRSQDHPTDKCPCQCDQCTTAQGPPSEANCEQGQANGQGQALYSASVSVSNCSCCCTDCRELCELIKRQQCRICQLEAQVSRQTKWHQSMQQKINELCEDFGSMGQEQTGS